MSRIKYKEAAKLDVRKGRPSFGAIPKKTDLNRLYTKEDRSIREVAEILGCSKDMVHRKLIEYGIERKADNKRSKLRILDENVLKAKVEKKGLTKAARELKVDIRTLKKFLSRIKH